MTWLFIHPSDVWLFRDGKPFSSNEDHSARSLFPPTPFTVQGSLRQAISERLGVARHEYVTGSTAAAKEAIRHIGAHGDLTNTGLFSMRGPYIGVQQSGSVANVLLPAPADLLYNETNKTFTISKPQMSLGATDLQKEYRFLEVIHGHENLPTCLMTADVFERYLNGGAPAAGLLNHDAQFESTSEALKAGKQIIEMRQVVTAESRIGVSTDSATSSGEEGLLYQVQFARLLAGAGLLVEVDDRIPTKLLEGTITIGGEQRLATVEAIPPVTLPRPAGSIASGRFKVIVTTPSYFSGGWEPKQGDWSAVFGRPVSFAGAALYRPLKIGGWSNAGNSGRVMHNYAAPGSVYFFTTQTPFTPPAAFTENPGLINAPAAGLGQYAVGYW